MVPRKVKAGKFWALIFIQVSVWDYWALKTGHETASGFVYRLIANKYTRWPTLIFMMLTVKHLAMPKLLPKVDPYGAIALVVKGTNGTRILGIEPRV